METDIIISIYRDVRTVFRLRDIAMLTGETDFNSLNKSVNYYVRTGKLENPRKGIYAKPGYDPEELIGQLYTPSYISLDYVLRNEGVIFQYDTQITAVSYVSRTIEIENRTFVYRKIKDEIMADIRGISIKENHVSIANPERAFLDLLYLNKNYFFDNLDPLNKSVVFRLLPLYQSKALSARVKKLFPDD